MNNYQEGGLVRIITYEEYAKSDNAQISDVKFHKEYTNELAKVIDIIDDTHIIIQIQYDQNKFITDISMVKPERKANTYNSLLNRKVKIKSIKQHEYLGYVCLNEYLGKTGYIVNETLPNELGHVFVAIMFDKNYMNAIDDENHTIRFEKDELEFID